MHFDYPEVSFVHLRIYVIDCGCDDCSDAKGCISPLVYAQNLSPNSTRVTRTDYADLVAPSEYKLRKGDSPLLLNDGDILDVGSEMTIQYVGRGADKITIREVNPRKHAERKVS